MDDPCPCGLLRPFDACCGPFLAGWAEPPTAEALMRSRYVAYTRNAIDYIEATSGGEARTSFSRKDASAWAKAATFTKLEVIQTSAGGPDDQDGVVEFVASFREQGKDRSHRERSLFAKEAGRWRYVGVAKGETVKKATADVGRNDPCPCGSGLKFKKCHGR